MQPSDMSMLLFAFAKLRFRDRQMMARIAEATPTIIGQFRAEDITYFLAAFARLDVQHRLVFNLFAREIARRLHDFSAAQLGELVYAYARLGLRHELLLGVLKKRVTEVVKALKPWHLAMITNGFARLEVADERFFTIIASEVCRKAPDFSGQCLALVANAYARLSVRNRFLLEILGDEAFRKRGELAPQSVALVLNAHARLQLPSPVLFDYFAQEVPRRMRAQTLQSVCLVASAFARQRRAEPSLFEKLGDFACGKAAELYPRAVSTLMYSFAEVDIRHGVLFYNVPKYVIKNIAAFSTDELGMVAHAYGHFQMVHLQLFDAITAALPERTLVDSSQVPLLEGKRGDDDEERLFEDEPAPLPPAARPPRPGALVGLLEAYARLTIYEAEVLRLLCDALVARGVELSAPQVVQVARSAEALSFAHPGVIRLAIDCMTSHAEDLPIEQLELLGKAIEGLGAAAPAGSPAQRLLERPSAAAPDSERRLPELGTEPGLVPGAAASRGG